MNTLLQYLRYLAVLSLIICVAFAGNSSAQRATNSVLVNFGRLDCGDTWDGSDLTLIGDAQTIPDLFLQCNTSTEIGNIFSKYVSYNAINNKLYINDVGDFANSNIYILNMGLPTSVTCPTISGVSYTIPDVVLNQFEFDALGDLYALSDYNLDDGTADIGAYDDTTGQLQSGSLKNFEFPAGNFPDDVQNGDIAITPNGRLFAVFGGTTSRLYEITNYSKTVSGTPTATYLGSPDKVCYAMCYDNGYLIIGGTDLAGYCYTFKYDIANGVLGSEEGSPINDMPVDDTSFSPSIGVSMKLTSAVQVDATHYDLTYMVDIRNMGNVRVGSVQLKDDLGEVFGDANVSNVSTSFISNGAGLTLNNSYNGTTATSLFQTNQLLFNYPSNKTAATIQINVRVANPIPSFIYYNSAIFTGRMGSDSTLLIVRDSSNNYTSAFSSVNEAIDPNNNNVADDYDEGIPTPWMVGMTLPIELVTFDVQEENGGVSLAWTTLSEKNGKYFAVERSMNAITFDSIGTVKGSGVSTQNNQYSYFDFKFPKGTLYYRLKQVDDDGSFSYSEVKVLNIQSEDEENEITYTVFPNPATNYLLVESSGITDRDATLEMHNAYGNVVFTANVPASPIRQRVTLPELPNGYYLVSVRNASNAASFFKIFVNHK